MTPLQAQSPVSRYMALVLRSVFKPALDTRNQLQFCIWNESHALFSVPQQSQATIPASRKSQIQARDEIWNSKGIPNLRNPKTQPVQTLLPK